MNLIKTKSNPKIEQFYLGRILEHVKDILTITYFFYIYEHMLCENTVTWHHKDPTQFWLDGPNFEFNKTGSNPKIEQFLFGQNP